MKGILISFEGGEGSGKTEQIKLLADEFLKQGRKVLTTREPGGTAIAEQIRKILLSVKNEKLAFTAEVLLFQSARAQIYNELILPALKKGKVVLCDRSRDSSVVYQGMARGFGAGLIEKLNDISTQNTFPDITILLDVPVELGLKRRKNSEKMDRLDMEKKDFHEKARKGYLGLAEKNDHKRWLVIDGSKTIAEIHKKIVKTFKKKKIM